LVVQSVAVPAFAAQIAAVKTGDVALTVRAGGTVLAEDLFRLKSTIDGRVEKVLASTGAWRTTDEPLALIASRETAAMIDARGSQNAAVAEDRWKTVYKPSAIRCSADCYVLRVYARPLAWVKPASALFVAAGRLTLVGRVRAEDAHLIENGQDLAFWPANAPGARRLKAKIAHVRLDVPADGFGGGSAATFTVALDARNSLPPGAAWEGELVVLRRRNGRVVPTAALIHHDGAVYVPVRVSTGATTSADTEITAGLGDASEVLVLDDAALQGAARHAPGVDHDALRRKAEAWPAPAQEPEAPARRRADKPDYAEDPYGD
jgi:hypothetical protein